MGVTGPLPAIAEKPAEAIKIATSVLPANPEVILMGKKILRCKTFEILLKTKKGALF
jgi:hypothetical protein